MTAAERLEIVVGGRALILGAAPDRAAASLGVELGGFLELGAVILNTAILALELTPGPEHVLASLNEGDRAEAYLLQTPGDVAGL